MLAPLMTAVVALSAGGAYALLNWRQGVAVRHATATDIDNFKTMGQAQEQLAQVRAEVFRTLALIASMDEATVKAKRADLARQVEGVQRIVETLPGNTGNDADIAAGVKTAAPLLAQFLKQSDKAIDLSGTDPNIGIGAMRAAENTYAEVAKAMQGLVARNESLNNARADAGDAANLRLTLMLGLLVLLATGSALFVAWRLQSRVVGELAAAARLAQDVAAGKLDSHVHSDAADEIGDLVRGLGHMVDRLRTSMRSVRAATDHISTAAAEIASGNTDLSQRTEQAEDCQ